MMQDNRIIIMGYHQVIFRGSLGMISAKDLLHNMK